MKKCSGNADALLLPSGQAVPQFFHQRVITFGQCLNKVVNGCFLSGTDHFFPGCPGFSHRYIGLDGIVKNDRFLGDKAFHLAKIGSIDVSHIPPGNLDTSGLYIPKTHEQFQQRGFPGTTAAMNPENTALWDIQADLI